MTHRIVFRPSAEADLQALYDYLTDVASPERADAYLGRIEAFCMGLSTFPERGTIRSDLWPGLRIIGFERRVSIAFLVDEDVVRIIRVLYGGRDYPEIWPDA